MQFRVLGPLEVVDDDGALVRLGSARERYVLATLLVSADRLVPAERLIDALWDEPPPTARQQLQNLIASLRRRLAPHAPDLVATRPFGYELQMGPHTLDLAEFRRLVADARAADRPEEAARDLEHAVSLWRGAALGDVAPAADASTETLQQALHDERVAAVDLLVDALDQLGRHDDVLTVAGAQLEHDPWNERLLEHRLRALAATGRRSEATEAYRRLRRRFIDELGVPPNRSLAELNTRILEGGPLVAPVARHRVVPRELPAPTWTLVGREALLGAVLTRLAPRAPDDRRGSRSVVAAAAQAARPPALVVLVGVGGVGKTALAVTAGHALADAYPDGTLYASLDGGRAGAVDPHDVAARFLRALGVDGTSIPAGREDRIALYRTTIAGRRLLTVIDGAATESQVRPLLPTSPGSGAIVTSRSRLAGLVGVRRHTVQPLTPEDSLALLAELSGPERDVRADAAGALTDISALCGHLPLALCVAGSKLATNPTLELPELRDRLTQQHARLDELSAGDIDVRASIESSVQDLPGAARVLFRRLGVAPGPDWPAWVARRLLHGVAREIEAHHALDELIDRHLVEPTGRDGAGQPRYRVHSLVGELAAEHLEAEETGHEARELEHALSSAWLDLARVAGPRLEGDSRPLPEPEGDGSLDAAAAPSDWFESERTNLVGAALTAARLGDPLLAARVALAVGPFLTVRAYDDDRERVLRAALESPTADAERTVDDPLRLQLLGALFAVTAQRRRPADLPAVAAESLAVARRIDDPDAEQRALSQSAWAAMALHRFDEALDGFARTAALAERRGDVQGRALAEARRGVVLRNVGRAAEGDPLLQAMVTLSRRDGPRRDCSIWLVTRAEGLVDLGRADEAEELLDEALAIALDLRDEVGEAHCRLALARVHAARGALGAADEELASARRQLDPRADDEADLEVLRLELDLAVHRGAWGRAAPLASRLVAGRRRADVPLDLAADLARLAAVASAAARTAGTADPGDTDPEPTWREVGAILHDLRLGPEALRLPSPPYPDPAVAVSRSLGVGA
ncbi:BTAD domain-containing putative transcriptional regulator [Terrabacter aeriphilus]|uniref:BTAD domain-containing putative transcriptional regulator n=1 Tax=Terrabacter aeriphilus TaxID=515662 RepID=A0ABP9JFX2_9MICO